MEESTRLMDKQVECLNEKFRTEGQQTSFNFDDLSGGVQDADEDNKTDNG